MGAEEDFGGVFHGMAYAVYKRILNFQPGTRQCASEVLAFEKRPRVDNRHSEFLPLLVCCDQGLFHNRASRKCDDDIAILNLLRCAGGDDLVSDGNFFADKVVDEFAQLCFGGRFGDRGVDGRDGQFEGADGISLTDGKRTTGGKIGNLVRKVSCEMASERCPDRRSVRFNDLDD